MKNIVRIGKYTFLEWKWGKEANYQIEILPENLIFKIIAKKTYISRFLLEQPLRNKLRDNLLVSQNDIIETFVIIFMLLEPTKNNSS